MKNKYGQENEVEMLTLSQIYSRHSFEQDSRIESIMTQTGSNFCGFNMFGNSYAIQEKRKNSQKPMLVRKSINEDSICPKKMMSQLSTGIEERKQSATLNSKRMNQKQSGNTVSSFFTAELKESSLLKNYEQKLVKQQQNYNEINRKILDNTNQDAQLIKERLNNSLRNQYILEKELIRLKSAIAQQQKRSFMKSNSNSQLNIDSIISIKVCPTKDNIIHKKQSLKRKKRYQTWDNRFFNV